MYPTRGRRVFVDIGKRFACVRLQWYDTAAGTMLEPKGEYRGKCVFTPPKQGDHILLLRAI